MIFFTVLWLDRMLTQALFEHALPAKGALARRLPKRGVDDGLSIGLPVLFGAVLTGLLMLWLDQSPANAPLGWEISFGSAAIALNMWCVRRMLRRCT